MQFIPINAAMEVNLVLPLNSLIHLFFVRVLMLAILIEILLAAKAEYSPRECPNIKLIFGIFKPKSYFDSKVL